MSAVSFGPSFIFRFIVYFFNIYSARFCILSYDGSCDTFDDSDLPVLMPDRKVV